MNSLATANRFRCLLREPSKHVQRWMITKVFASTFKFDDLQIITNKNIDQNENPFKEELSFGNTFTDHMFEVKWTEANGWDKPVISPMHNFSLHPAAKVFHYAQELFEGMKGYYCEDGKIRLFRPDMNMTRMLKSARRAGLADFDKDELLKCIKKLVQIDRRWVPNKPNHSLYIRPTFMGIEPALGVSSAKEQVLFVILSPVGSYFKSDRNVIEPVSLYADENAVRAWPGGCGDNKLGFNYGPTIKIHMNAVEQGCQQVLWLFGKEQQLTEIGTMNVFVFLKNENGEKELITPPLEDGLILPGVTRDSILKLCKQWNKFKISEKRITMNDVKKALNEKRLIEIFGAGTACVVSPVSRIKYQNQDINLPMDNSSEKITPKLLSTITDIYYGRVKNDWMFPIDDV